MGKRGTVDTRMQEDQEDRRYAAIAIAIAACVLRPCPDHPDILLLVDGADIQDARVRCQQVGAWAPQRLLFVASADARVDQGGDC